MDFLATYWIGRAWVGWLRESALAKVMLWLIQVRSLFGGGAND
jgi:hypothetical protein